MISAGDMTRFRFQALKISSTINNYQLSTSEEIDKTFALFLEHFSNSKITAYFFNVLIFFHPYLSGGMCRVDIADIKCDKCLKIFESSVSKILWKKKHDWKQSPNELVNTIDLLANIRGIIPK